MKHFIHTPRGKKQARGKQQIHTKKRKCKFYWELLLTRIHNLSIGKQLRYNTMAILAFVCLTALIGLVNQLHMNHRLLSFYQDSYSIHTTALYSKNSLLLIQNYMYRAIATDKENLQSKYIQESENYYLELENSIISLSSSNSSIHSLTAEDQKELTVELEKFQRYRDQVLSATNSGDIPAVFKTYKNDYVPILASITTTLESVIENANHYADQYISLSKRQTVLSIISYILLTISGGFLAILISRKTTKGILSPLNEIQNCMNEMAMGNLHTEIAYHSLNELGNVCEATRVTQSRLNRYIDNIIVVLNQLENKNLTHTPEEDYVGDFLPIKESLISIIRFLHDNISQIQCSCEDAQSMSINVQDQSLTIQSGAKTQTNTIQSLTTQIHTISDFATNNADLATKLQEIFRTMTDYVSKAQNHMELLENQVASIKEQSRQITTVTQIIEGIARKTQLVALNATIEAAHAANTGGTFLVVANEMTNLSKQCMEAVSTIRPFIQTMLTNIQTCSEMTATTSDSLSYTVNISHQMHTLVSSIHSSSQTQYTLVDQITEELPKVTAISYSNEHAAEENIQAVQKHLTEMERLLNFVHCFQL
ncbi:methyl-accepting chemotaxis protein [Anaerosporobacter faecicola]|uniref:methyl-accepting chemotaxis protein n=1 Tax=Anaerosporobacter faecicola TaxID=2718714 RepID=UPI00143A59C1|nr:methyl-accepting chemotaxis protein [Anaerosporobacter faecicola]